MRWIKAACYVCVCGSFILSLLPRLLLLLSAISFIPAGKHVHNCRIEPYTPATNCIVVVFIYCIAEWETSTLGWRYNFRWQRFVLQICKYLYFTTRTITTKKIWNPILYHFFKAPPNWTKLVSSLVKVKTIFYSFFSFCF